MLAACHPREDLRLQALRRYEILDTPQEKEFDDLVRLVADICEAPVAVVNLIDSDRQWFKAETGLGVRSTPLETSLCSHVILEDDFVEVPDTLEDPRMSDNPLCLADGGFRFYAGALLKTDAGLPIGTLCVLDTKPRTLTDLQRRTLKVMAERVMSELNFRLALKQSNLLRREIDHRVKNSLASVGAIIGLQSARSDHPQTRDALAAIQSRLGALEALHEELQQESGDDRVDLSRLIERSVAKLRRLVREDIAIEVDLAPHTVASDQANAIALTTNEFVTNSAKHGLSQKGGAIRIEGRPAGDRYRLTFSDTGTGDSDTLARIADSKGLGSRIIRTLVGSVGGEAKWSERRPGLQLDFLLPAG